MKSTTAMTNKPIAEAAEVTEPQRMETVRNASRQTGLPVSRLRKLYESGKIVGFKCDSWLYLNMNDLNRKLADGSLQ